MEDVHAAIALRYDPDAGDACPRIVACGKGETADAILRAAAEHDIPLRQDAALAGALGELELGASVPPELFRAVAEVLAWVYAIEGANGVKRNARRAGVSAAGRAGRLSDGGARRG